MRTRVAGKGCFETELQGLKPFGSAWLTAGLKAAALLRRKTERERPKKRLSVVGGEAD
jgi:hypothetical protein